MNEFNITSAKYTSFDGVNNDAINAVMNGVTMSVPLDPDNRHYAEIIRQVEAGTLTIADAD